MAAFPAEKCCEPLSPVRGRLQEPQAWTELRCVLVSLSVQPLHGCSAAGCRAASAPLLKMQGALLMQDAVLYLAVLFCFVFFFFPEKNSFVSTKSLACINLGGLSLARSLGKRWDVGSGASFLQHLLPSPLGDVDPGAQHPLTPLPSAGAAEPSSSHCHKVTRFFRSCYPSVIWL